MQPSRRSRSRLGFVAASSVIVVTALAFSATSASADTSPTNFTNDQEANAAAAAAGETITSELASDPTFAGAEITPDGLVVSVVGTPSVKLVNSLAAARSVAARSAVTTEGAAIDVPVTTRTVRYSQEDLDAATAQIDADFYTWQAQGVDLTSWGGDTESNQVEVVLENYTPEAAAAIEAAYGPIVSVSPESGTGLASSRTADGPSTWHGGAKITYIESCSSWFPATRTSDSKPVLLTAGHCGNGRFSNNGNWVGTTSKLTWDSTVDARDCCTDR